MCLAPSNVVSLLYTDVSIHGLEKEKVEDMQAGATVSSARKTWTQACIGLLVPSVCSASQHASGQDDWQW
jgi:hypothetical protein